jgi:hypothetical protein
MTKLYRIAEIDLPAFDVLADDNDIAWVRFQSAPGSILLRHSQAEEGKTGIAWRVDEGRAWELVQYGLQRS